jgi:hypothetical protein
MISSRRADGQRLLEISITAAPAAGIAVLTKSARPAPAALVRAPAQRFKMIAMNDEAVKAAAGRFVKSVGITAQREIEKAVRNALANGKLQGGEKFTAAVTLSSEPLDLNVTIFSKIEL